MTDEMLDIINAKEQHIAIQAYSGTGKTTTMLEYVKAHPNERILFLVYNKAMANDFTERLKGINCCCEIKTIHALAYRWFMRNYLAKQLGNITVLDIKNYINNSRLSYEDYSKIKFYFDMFLSSSLDSPLKLKPLEDWDKKLLIYVNKLWDYYSKDSFIISHNIYLKLFQLNKVKLDYDTIIVDECLDGDMFVKTDNGFKRIKTIHKMYQEGKFVKVLSFNEKTQQFEYKEVLGTKKSENRNIYKLKTEGLNSLYCTENHKILTQRGYVRLDEIIIGKDQIILDRPENEKTKIKLNEDQYQLVLGSYLGDGHVRSRSNNEYPTYHVCFTHSEKQINYLRMKSSCMNIDKEYIGISGYTGKHNIYRSNMSTTFALDKFIEDSLDDMNEKSLAIWYMDDGTMNFNGVSYYANIDLGDKSSELINKLINILVNNFNFSKNDFNITEYRDKYHKISFKKEGSIKLFNIVSPYIHPDLFYKIPKEYIPKQQYIWDNKFKNYGSNFVKSIEFCKIGDVYDISVQDNHNFVTSYGYTKKNKPEPTGIVVHNCNDVNECMLDIVTNNLDKKVIVVGDSYQMINAFNFNTNGLQIMKESYGFKEYKLTDSFRIGEDVAKVSSKYLSNMYNENIDFNGLGKTKITDIELRDGIPNNPIYILCRTRLGGLKFIYSYIKRFRSRKVYYVGGLNSFKINDIEKMIKSNGNIFLNGKKYNVKELKRMINEGLRDIEIIRTVQMYDFCCQDSKVLERLRQSETTDKSEANVILLTAHQSKGLTLNNVIIADDFKDSIDLKIENDLEYDHNYLERMANAEVNLLYVALTRATNKLDLNSIRKENSNYFESNFLGGIE